MPSRRAGLGWALGLLAICVAPGVLMALGVDLSTRGPVEADTSSPVESAFGLLRGSFIHMLLEWTAFCAALGVCVLAFVRHRISRDPSLPVIGVALACAGAMDAFHTLAADRLIQATADNRDLIPFTWAICRSFNAIILMVGVGFFVLRKREQRRRPAVVPVMCIGFVLLAYLVISFCATSETLTRAMFPDALFKRPYDLAPIVPFLICAAVVLPLYIRRRSSIFAWALLFSLIPQIATQVYMAFGSSALFDSAFNVAHALKTLAYLVPAMGLLLEFVSSSQQSRQLANELESSKARAEAVLETTIDGIIVIDSKGIIQSCNRATESMLGYRSEELLGENVSMLMGSPHRENHDGYLESYLGTGVNNAIGFRRELSAVRKDGSSFPIQLSVSKVEIAGAVLFTGLLCDLTEQKTLQSQLAQAQKLESIGQLAAGIAHEINTPTQYATDNVRFMGDASHDLAQIVDLVSELVGDSAGEVLLSAGEVKALQEKMDQADLKFLWDELPKASQESLEGLGTVAKIVRAMKEFSHPGQTEKDDVDLNRAIETAVTVARNEWKYVADLELNLAPDLPPVACIQGAFNQVILNLVVNAAHAIVSSNGEGSVQKGLITIETSASEEWVEVRVRDNGCGMPAEVRDRVFDPFFTTKEVGVGTGQGLAIAHSVIVDKHQGTIRVESEDGVGTEFIIQLPLETTHAH